MPGIVLVDACLRELVSPEAGMADLESAAEVAHEGIEYNAIDAVLIGAMDCIEAKNLGNPFNLFACHLSVFLVYVVYDLYVAQV